MIRYAIVNPQGLVIGTGESVSIEDAIASSDEFGTVIALGDGEVAVADEYYLDDDEFLPVPPKPEDWLEWNGSAWADPRDPAQIAVDLYQARYHTNTSKDLVFYRLSVEGAYPVSELADDTNYFPDRVEEYLNTLPTIEHDQVKAALKYEPLIWRLHPHVIGDVGIVGFIPWLLSEYSITITEAQLDVIFEVPVPPPLYTP